VGQDAAAAVGGRAVGLDEERAVLLADEEAGGDRVDAQPSP
jgi:hypothetical protein